jgi:hypothetical protein
VLFLSDIYFVFFMCLVSIVVCVCSLWYLFCLLHVSCVYCCVLVLSDIYFVFFMCLVSIVVCVGSLWYLFCLLHVSSVYCCVCWFSLIFILSSSCVLCLLLCVLVLSDIYFVFFMLTNTHNNRHKTHEEDKINIRENQHTQQ